MFLLTTDTITLHWHSFKTSKAEKAAKSVAAVWSYICECETWECFYRDHGTIYCLFQGNKPNVKSERLQLCFVHIPALASLIISRHIDRIWCWWMFCVFVHSSKAHTYISDLYSNMVWGEASILLINPELHQSTLEMFIPQFKSVSSAEFPLSCQVKD